MNDDASRHTLTILALADLHMESNSYPKDFISSVSHAADILCIVGDISSGSDAEIHRFEEMITQVEIPLLVVLGNHDHDCDSEGRNVLSEYRRILAEHNHIHFLDGDVFELKQGNESIQFLGLEGCDGGYDEVSLPARCKSDIKKIASYIQSSENKVQYRVVLTHYAPFVEMLGDDPGIPEDTCGNNLVGEELKKWSADIVLHGHLHKGTPEPTPISHSSITAKNVSLLANSGRICLITIHLKDGDVTFDFSSPSGDT